MEVFYENFVLSMSLRDCSIMKPTPGLSNPVVDQDSGHKIWVAKPCALLSVAPSVVIS